MSWWGKLIGGGFGFMLGGPMGAVLGAAIGHQFDKGLDFSGMAQPGIGNQERTQLAFFTATFSVMGYLAKVDGQVSKDEIRMAEMVMSQMHLNAEQRKTAIELFNQGKAADFPLHDMLAQFRQECHRRRNLTQMFMEILISMCMADGRLDAAENHALKDIGQHLGFPPMLLEQLIQMVAGHQSFAGERPVSRADSLASAYQVLGVDSSASDAEIKKAYRRLMGQHHPDKLVSKGLPDEMIQMATEKTREIRKAYDTIKDTRQSTH